MRPWRCVGLIWPLSMAEGKVISRRPDGLAGLDLGKWTLGWVVGTAEPLERQ